MRVVIADDEPPALERLAALFRNIPDVTIVAEARDGIEAGRAIEEHQPDLVLLDIQMPGLSGLALASSLPTENRPEIVFVTAFENFAPDAFDVDAADYLLKPVRFDRLRQAIDRARRRRDGRFALLNVPAGNPAFDDAIWVATREGQVKVSVAMIDWIEAAGDYVMLHTPLRGYLHRATMSAIEARLDPVALRRVHRSAFVRLSRVTEIRRQDKWLTSLVLENGVEIPVGPNYAREIMAALKAPAGN